MNCSAFPTVNSRNSPVDSENVAIFVFAQEDAPPLSHPGAVNGVYTAFSRDQAQKVYVQDRIAENSAEVWRVLGEQEGYFLLAGAWNLDRISVCDLVHEIY